MWESNQHTIAFVELMAHPGCGLTLGLLIIGSRSGEYTIPAASDIPVPLLFWGSLSILNQ